MTQTHKVLVAEDNDFVRMQIVKFLQGDGYETQEAVNGEEALEAINKDITLAIVDVRMEPMGGFDFIRSIRGSDNDTPIILVTGDQNPDLLNDASKLGVVAVLMKPVQKDRLLKTVRRTVLMRERKG